MREDPGITVVRAGILLDGTGREPQRGVDIVVEGSTIREIRPAETEGLPTDAVLMDHREHVVMPGFIDLHTHLRNPLPVDVPKHDSYRYRIETDPELAVFYAAHAARATLASGFTTLRMMGGTEFVALRRAIDAGLLPGPHIEVSGLVIMTAGHTDRTLPLGVPREGRWGAWQRADGVDAVRMRVRQLIAQGADFIKFDASGGLHAPDIRMYSTGEVEAIVDEAHNHGVRVAAHAHGKVGALRALRAGVDTLEHGTFLDEECIEEMARRGTTFVPTLAIMHDMRTRGQAWGVSPEQLVKYQEFYERRCWVTKTAYDAGVPIGLGTDSSGWLAPHGLNGVEFKLLHEAGLSPADCVRAGTEWAACALGLDGQLGSLTVGKRADLVVVDVNPLDDLASLEGPGHIHKVMRGGRVVAEGDDRGSTLRWEERFDVGQLR